MILKCGFWVRLFDGVWKSGFIVGAANGMFQNRVATHLSTVGAPH